jgi:hypothetical protein
MASRSRRSESRLLLGPGLASDGTAELVARNLLPLDLLPGHRQRPAEPAQSVRVSPLCASPSKGAGGA